MTIPMDLDDTLDRIKRHEGFQEEVYKDPLGIETVGYGFTIKDLVLPEGISSTLLRIIVLNLTVQLYDKFPWFGFMPSEIKSVIVEMCYQMGITGFSGFKVTIAHFNRREWEKASQEMLNSEWAGQTPKRAQELSLIVGSIRPRA